MKLTHTWAMTASLTVCASLVLAVHDASYRPAFVQIAMVAVTTAKEQVRKEKADKDDSIEESECNCLLLHCPSPQKQDETPEKNNDF